MDINRIRIPTIFLLISIICFLFIPLSIHAASRGISVISDLSHQSGKLGEYRALIIGINDYNNPQIPDLETAVNDASAMAKLLCGRYGFHVELLLDRKATKEAIYKALRKLVSSTKTDDSVLIYYAGHGDLDRLTNEGWWIPADAKGGDPITYLENSTVQTYIRSMKARHVLLISDSCYSGTLFGRARAIPPVIGNKYYLNLYNEKSRWGMTSGNKTPVSDQGTGGHSVFAYQLLKELRNSEKPYISTQELYTRIAPIISNNSEQTPLCRPIRNTGDQGGEFVFVASSGAVIEKPAPVSSKAYLSVESNVSGAKVIIDGRYVGLTSLSNVEVDSGGHQIRVEKDGYEPYTRRISFEKGRIRDLHVILDLKAPLKSRLYVETQPAGARIRILNIGPVFYQGMELDAGSYHVEVSANGHETQKMWASLTSGQDKTLDIQLKPVAVYQAGPSQDQERIIFEDNFDNNMNNWMELDSSEQEIHVKNGKYRIIQKNNQASNTQLKIENLHEYDDFQIEAKFTKVSGIINYGYGIIWGAKNYNNAFWFVISGDGAFSLMEIKDGKVTSLRNWKTSNLIKKYNSTNILAVRKIGHKIALLINDMVVDHLDSPGFMGNKVGFNVQSEQTIDIDFIRIKTLGKDRG